MNPDLSKNQQREEKAIFFKNNRPRVCWILNVSDKCISNSDLPTATPHPPESLVAEMLPRAKAGPGKGCWHGTRDESEYPKIKMESMCFQLHSQGTIIQLGECYWYLSRAKIVSENISVNIGGFLWLFLFLKEYCIFLLEILERDKQKENKITH